MNWNRDKWKSRFDLVKQYYEEHGNINISQKEVIQGVWLGKWIVSQKKAMDSGKLTDHQVQMFKILPMDEVGRKDSRWWSMYEEAKKYYLKFGNLNIPKDYLTSDGKRLCDWIIRQKRSFKMGKMTLEHKKLLSDIGFLEDLEELRYKKVENYYLEQNHLLKIDVH